MNKIRKSTQIIHLFSIDTYKHANDQCADASVHERRKTSQPVKQSISCEQYMLSQRTI